MTGSRLDRLLRSEEPSAVQARLLHSSPLYDSSRSGGASPNRRTITSVFWVRLCRLSKIANLFLGFSNGVSRIANPFLDSLAERNRPRSIASTLFAKRPGTRTMLRYRKENFAFASSFELRSFKCNVLRNLLRI
jgi:hypothetical protein